MTILKKNRKRAFSEKNNKGKDFDDEEAEEDFDLPEKSTKPVHSSNKVTPMRQPARRSNVNMEVCVIKPNSVEDAREITETLLEWKNCNSESGRIGSGSGSAYYRLYFRSCVCNQR